MEKRNWLHELRRRLCKLLFGHDGGQVPAPRRIGQADTRLRLLASADLAEDRQVLRRFATLLGWLAVFEQDWRGALPMPACDASVVVPATAERAALLIAEGAEGLPSAVRALPVLFVAPLDLAPADLERARTVFAAVESKPLLLSSFRRSVLAVTGKGA